MSVTIVTSLPVDLIGMTFLIVCMMMSLGWGEMLQKGQHIIIVFQESDCLLQWKKSSNKENCKKNMEEDMHFLLLGGSQVLHCTTTNGSCLVLIPCLMLNGKHFIGGLKGSLGRGGRDTGITQILMNQTSGGCPGLPSLPHQSWCMAHAHYLPLFLSHQQRSPGQFQRHMFQRWHFPHIITAAIVGILIGNKVTANGKTQWEVVTVYWIMLEGLDIT